MPDQPLPPRDLSAFSSAGFDRGASRMKEILWFLVRWVFFDTSLPWPSSLRCALLRLFGARVGRGVVIRAKVNVTFPWRLSVGDHVWIGEEVLILSLAPVTLEDSVCISQRAFLCTGSHDTRRPSFDLVTKPITIRQGAWVAAQVFVGPGTEIGSGAVVLAGSVVSKQVPPGVMVRGNPAVVVDFTPSTEKGTV
jgi:putative colanic acid biosynthesis acetyltransferase WcaF